jgi:hypothetical protein
VRNARAARTADGLVNTTFDADNASRNAARVPASSRDSSRHGDSAITRAPCAAAARRSASCPPTGRREMK